MALATFTCPHGNEIDPAKQSCAECDASPPPVAADVPGEGEQLCAEAAARGLPDGLEVEVRGWRAWRDARREATACRKLADVCEERARKFLEGDLHALKSDGEGGTVEADSEDQARRWLDLAAKFRQAIAKAIDTQSKVLKLGAAGTALRERQAAKDRRDRLLAQLKLREGSN